MNKFNFSVREIDVELLKVVNSISKYDLMMWGKECIVHCLEVMKIKCDKCYFFIDYVDYIFKNDGVFNKDIVLFANFLAKKEKKRINKEIIRASGSLCAAFSNSLYSLYTANYCLSAIIKSRLKNKEDLYEKEKRWQFDKLMEKQKKKVSLD